MNLFMSKAILPVAGKVRGRILECGHEEDRVEQDVETKRRHACN